MKIIFGLTLLITSFSAFSGICPEISGSYSDCSGTRQNFKIHQEVRKLFSIYDIRYTTSYYRRQNYSYSMKVATDNNIYSLLKKGNMPDFKGPLIGQSKCKKSKVITKFLVSGTYEKFNLVQTLEIVGEKLKVTIEDLSDNTLKSTYFCPVKRDTQAYQKCLSRTHSGSACMHLY